MANIIGAVTGGFTFLWNGLSKSLNIICWFLREGHRVKGLFVVAFITAMKLSYDAVISGLNDVIFTMGEMDLSSSVSSSSSDFLEFANAVFPVSEMLAMLVALIHLAVLCLIIRAIRSFRLRLFA